jgi:hypothetical protein
MPYNNEAAGSVKVAIHPDGSFHGDIRKADWAQVGKTKSYLAEALGKFAAAGKTAIGKLRLKYVSVLSGRRPYTFTCDGRWVSIMVKVNPDSV